MLMEQFTGEAGVYLCDAATQTYLAVIGAPEQPGEPALVLAGRKGMNGWADITREVKCLLEGNENMETLVEAACLYWHMNAQKKER